MIKSKILAEINKQINEELYSAYLYLAMAAYVESKNMLGAAKWLKLQANEEVSHAMKFYHFVYGRGGVVEFMALPKPPKTFGTLKDIFAAALKHEQHISGRINFLYELALKEKDYAFKSFLKWFIDEQVEEESNAQAVLDRLEMAGSSKEAVFWIDKELGARKDTD